MSNAFSCTLLSRCSVSPLVITFVTYKKSAFLNFDLPLGVWSEFKSNGLIINTRDAMSNCLNVNIKITLSGLSILQLSQTINLHFWFKHPVAFTVQAGVLKVMQTCYESHQIWYLRNISLKTMVQRKKPHSIWLVWSYVMMHFGVHSMLEVFCTLTWREEDNPRIFLPLIHINWNQISLHLAAIFHQGIVGIPPQMQLMSCWRKSNRADNLHKCLEAFFSFTCSLFCFPGKIEKTFWLEIKSFFFFFSGHSQHWWKTKIHLPSAFNAVRVPCWNREKDRVILVADHVAWFNLRSSQPLGRPDFCQR